MSALVLDGKALAAQTEAELLARVEQLKAKSGGKTPILATILVGDDPASATYVKMKGNACRRVGMDSLAVELPSSTSTDELLARAETEWAFVNYEKQRPVRIPPLFRPRSFDKVHPENHMSPSAPKHPA